MSVQLETQIEVSVVLFTYLEQGRAAEELLSRGLLSLGEGSTNAFGSGLFVLTRSTAFKSPTSPNKDRAALPTMPIRDDERLEEAAHRLLKEQLGIYMPVRLFQTGIFDDPERSPFERVIAVNYWGFVGFEDLAIVLGGKDRVGLELVVSSSFLRKFDEAKNLDKYDGVSRFGFRISREFDSTHKKRLAKDAYGEKILTLDYDEMVFFSWRKLRHVFGGYGNPFRMLGAKILRDTFRISDLRQLYEAIRGEFLQADTFKRAMLGSRSYLEQLSESDSSKAGRPSLLYKLNDL